MAGRNNKKGRSSGGGGQAPAKQRAFQYQPSLYDKKDQKTVSTLKRALAYERKNGATPDEPHVRRLRDRLSAKVAEISRRAGSNRGIRLDVRSKGRAAANYRQNVKDIRSRAINAPGRAYNRSAADSKTLKRANVRVPERQVLSRRVVTRGQGNLFTGGFSGKAGNTLRPVIRNGRGWAKDRPSRKNTVRA
jgi:hypothetical protein